MKHVMVAVKDRAVDAYMKPMFVPHRNAAIRAFTDEVNRKESEMNKHPEDYDMYFLGEWNENTGIMENEPVQPELIARAQDLITL